MCDLLKGVFEPAKHFPKQIHGYAERRLDSNHLCLGVCTCYEHASSEQTGGNLPADFLCRKFHTD